MKKVLKKISILDELAKEMQVIGIEEQRYICGGSGGDSYGSGSGSYPGQGVSDCVIQSIAYMFGLSPEEVHARLTGIVQNEYGMSVDASAVWAGTGANFSEIELLMYSIAGSCNVNSYNANTSMSALGLIGPGRSNQGHAVVLNSYDASTNTYQYTDPQNNYSTGTISASDLQWIISGN
ncbi:hypothetical protein [uncultured Proteiniphilum sp.]|uniref:hypothetical protein n=1 Tax=uncultured Proteiniphilum sp. TaxID=497637 RepID=UPI00260D0DBE|nr:hypothetical protein [uncultured Proteiniphilum sp.]